MLWRNKRRGFAIFFAGIIGILPILIATTKVSAIAGFGLSMSPMDEKILLNPGDSYTSVFTLSSPDIYDTPVRYDLAVTGYYTDENEGNIFESCDKYCEMENWIVINSPTTGKLVPGERVEVYFTINVPNDAAGGGQYASILTTISQWTDDKLEDSGDIGSNDVKTTITEKMQMAHIVYAEITGDMIRQGEITDISILSFILDGNISGTSSVKNTGNVHSTAFYRLQVFPLFSDEEVYTNEEDPDTRIILPDRTLMNISSWDRTPIAGIFNVKYTVEFEGVVQTMEKVVIKCPIWLLFIIVFAIILIVFRLILKSKKLKR